MSSRILIVRLSALGDAALTLPLLAALRRALDGASGPEAFIGWVAGEGTSSLLRGFPGINRLHVWRNESRNLSGLLALAREVRKTGYEVSLDPQSLSKSAAIPFLAKIPRRVGFARFQRGGRELAPFLNNDLLRPPRAMKHIVSQTLHMGTALGLKMPEDFPVEIPVDGAALGRMRRWWRARGLSGRSVVFGVGAGWPTKVLPAGSLRALVGAAGERGYGCVLLWGPGEKDDIASWREAFGESAVLAPPTDVPEMTALLSLAERYAGPDSAALHLAALLGRPTFSWFGASDPARTSPRGSKHRHVSGGLPCQPCWKRRCRSLACMRELTAGRVVPAFTEWLEG